MIDTFSFLGNDYHSHGEETSLSFQANVEKGRK